jgi:hypothetical protein
MLARLVAVSMFATLGTFGTINAIDADTKPEPTIAGTWDSTYGNVRITQQGNRVSGQYPCCGGGTFKGRIVEGFVKFHWSEPRGAGEGEGVWRIKKDGTLEGSWGRGQSDTDGGEWNLWRSRQIAQ